ncbi:COG4280 domain-containing protein [Mesorhizobium sp. VK23B]|uniref:COG4280 domain-containing protein n=1 Tax=Mesorhizobium dulcispinae TaxID=3072316 RepID=A0ABU4XH73_9HYPH|nr:MULTISPECIES: COG4280 domain-containing protein [unclassified Mesorhizobium]MDX8467767.1 COG4280 domain-containing protein [Mesorhizobium sp. VK23B]MDX8474105.1 COG4280 domain-containing protein [Mesorhizobium sp. VK23A]MDX8520980.1 COG4280 domain-containing protein [Mesorhizobium sp. VK23D]
MHELTPVLSTVTASFLASFVEVVEAFTIVLAVGVTRGWRPALTGAASALAVLAALVLAFGPLLALVPITLLQFAVGVLLILFGMRWLRKAILRSAGVIALRDEEAAFSRQTDALSRQAGDRRADYLAGVAAFKAVLLEGVEVVFIVIAVGAAHGQTLEAGFGALAAFVLVMLIGLAVHRPLARVPENALKFVVGLMLTSFGVFWTGEGLGAEWPGEDFALLAIFAVIATASFAMVRWLRSTYVRPVGEIAR